MREWGRRAQYEQSRRRAGIARESVWIQSTSNGDVAVVVIEAPDVQAALGGLATSEESFDQWFRQHIKDVHGIGLAAGVQVPEPTLDFRA